MHDRRPDRSPDRPNQPPAGTGPITSAIIGVWSLRHYFDVTEGGPAFHPFGLHPEGLLTYTHEGYVSALLMAPGRPNLSGNGLTDGTPDEYIAAASGFIGYTGTYQVDEALSVVTHHPVVAFAPNMVGSAQERIVEIDGDVLVLTALHPYIDNSPRTESRLEWIRVRTGPSSEAL